MEKKNAKQAVERLKTLYSKKGENQIFAHVNIAVPDQTRQNIEARRKEFTTDKFPDMDILFPLWEEYLSCFNDLEDDWFPAIYPRQYDQGIYGALFGAEVELNTIEGVGWLCSATLPFEDRSYDDLLSFEFNPDDPWVVRLKNDLQYLSRESRERFGIAIPITCDGLNFTHQITGTRTFTDIYDCPEQLNALLQLGVDLNIKLVEIQHEAIDMVYEDGVFDLFNAGWIPKRSIPMSVDNYNLCAAEVYEEFGLPFQQQLIDHFGGGNYHLHGNGRHLLPQLAKLQGLAIVKVNDDGAEKTAFDQLEKIKQQAGDLVLVISCQLEKFLKGLGEKSLPGGVFYLVNGCQTISEANRLMEKVCSYRV